MARPIGLYEYTPEELLKESKLYFEHCDKEFVENSQGKLISYPKTMSWLRKWLRIGKNLVSAMRSQEGFSGIIWQIYDEIEEDVQLKASLWFTNPQIAVRNLSANFDWRDKSEVISSVTVSAKVDTSQMTSSELDRHIKEVSG